MPTIRLSVSAARLATALACLGLTLAVAPPAKAQQADPDVDVGLRGTQAATGNGPLQPLPDPDFDTVDPPPPLTDAPNYGKPRPRLDPRLKYTGRARQPGRPLPPLTPYPTSAVARQQLRLGVPVEAATAGANNPDTPPPGPTVAIVPPIPAKSRPKVDNDPFAPVGIGVGGLRLVPYVEVDSGYDSNPNRTTSPSGGSWMTRAETGLSLKSDWSVHQLTGNFEFGYDKFYTQPDANRPDGQGKLDLRVDVTRDASLDFELRGNLSTQRPGSPEVSANVTNSPLITTYGATAGGTQNLGNLQLGLHGTIDRTDYQDGMLSDGLVIPLSVSDYTAYGLQTRVGYQITPGIIPFADATIDTRRHDQAVDDLGFARNSNGVAGRIGTTFELSRLLTGQIAVGYAQRVYADPNLPVLNAPTVDASLVWTATPLTTVTLRGVTVLNESTVANASGYVTHGGSLEIDHALRRNVTIGAIGAVSRDDYKGVDLHQTTYSGTLKVDYNLTRSLVFRGSFTHERLVSTAPGSDYTANVFLLGLKLQR